MTEPAQPPSLRWCGSAWVDEAGSVFARLQDLHHGLACHDPAARRQFLVFREVVKYVGRSPCESTMAGGRRTPIASQPLQPCTGGLPEASSAVWAVTSLTGLDLPYALCYNYTIIESSYHYTRRGGTTRA
jgi:hypothetical protein